MKVIEIFRSVQGEGKYMGMNAVFLRLWGCNLACEGCDTKWQMEQGYIEMRPSEVESEIRKFGEPKNLVITGGEPLLQWNELWQIVLNLYKSGWSLHVETNGTVPIPEKEVKKFTCITVSPKKNALKWNVLKYWSKFSNVIWKFVVSTRRKKNPAWTWNSANEIERMIQDLGLRRENVYLMPFGDNCNALREEGERTYWMALQLGVNYSDRIQIRLFRRSWRKEGKGKVRAYE